MATRDQIGLAGGEKAAFDKLMQGLRYAIEGATEIGVYQDSNHWAVIAMNMEKTLKLANSLMMKAAAGGVRGSGKLIQ